jgi:hypothetical protein
LGDGYGCLVSLCLQGIEPNSIAETTSALLDMDTPHTKFNRESKMVLGVFKRLAKVYQLRIGKDLGLTEVSLVHVNFAANRR